MVPTKNDLQNRLTDIAEELRRLQESLNGTKKRVKQAKAGALSRRDQRAIVLLRKKIGLS